MKLSAIGVLHLLAGISYDEFAQRPASMTKIGLLCKRNTRWPRDPKLQNRKWRRRG